MRIHKKLEELINKDDKTGDVIEKITKRRLQNVEYVTNQKYRNGKVNFWECRLYQSGILRMYENSDGIKEKYTR